jgi:hypothetical protein
MRPSLPLPHFMILFINFFSSHLFVTVLLFQDGLIFIFSLLDSTIEALPRFYIYLLSDTTRVFVPHNGKVWDFWMYRMLFCDNVYCNLCLHSTFTHSVRVLLNVVDTM